MKQRYLSMYFLLALFITACKDNQKTEQLAKREQALLERERQFAFKETDYRSLLHMRDSILAKNDTIMPSSWPEAVVGTWSSKVICKESNCNDYAVGDQRTAIWDFTSDSTGMYTKVINNNKLSRIFRGSFQNGNVALHFSTDTSAQKQVTMQVMLNQAGNDLIKGTQVIQVDNRCTAKFSVELVRASNQ
ncbi:hypothetical protein [Olivibacter domesticus]|uniref:Uncharacterized protein n=1 Tax=Olivibacter domesticus TaxID=407022 RepID=A0A1H7K9D4_OLID1|nr:hypothetical protein [Olivibacter domesticus]SEK83110.1 hypothetical protein SAMN05661044_01266 [Olivibacter domesticus]